MSGSRGATGGEQGSYESMSGERMHEQLASCVHSTCLHSLCYCTYIAASTSSYLAYFLRSAGIRLRIWSRIAVTVASGKCVVVF